MDKVRTSRFAVLLAMVCGALLVAAPAAAQDTSLSKPLADITVGDLFPNLIDNSTKSIGESWKESADQLVETAKGRSGKVDSAIKVKQDELSQLKKALKAAKKDKDFTESGRLEGRIQSEEIVVDVLKQLQKVSKQQLAAAEAWSAVADDLAAFAEANVNMDAYRSAGIVRPEEGEVDARMDASGYKAFTAHTEAMEALGASFATMGSKLKSMGNQRNAFLEDLEKGGHVRKE